MRFKALDDFNDGKIQIRRDTVVEGIYPKNIGGVKFEVKTTSGSVFFHYDNMKEWEEDWEVVDEYE